LLSSIVYDGWFRIASWKNLLLKVVSPPPGAEFSPEFFLRLDLGLPINS
jgi:hypothetical protein